MICAKFSRKCNEVLLIDNFPNIENLSQVGRGGSVKTVNPAIIEEQWDPMLRVTASLKQKTAPAHIVISRLTKNSDRLAKAFTALREQ